MVYAAFFIFKNNFSLFISVVVRRSCARMFRLRFAPLNMTIKNINNAKTQSFRHPETRSLDRPTKNPSVRRILRHILGRIAALTAIA